MLKSLLKQRCARASFPSCFGKTNSEKALDSGPASFLHCGDMKGGRDSCIPLSSLLFNYKGIQDVKANF